MRTLQFILLLFFIETAWSQRVYYEHYGVQDGLGQSQVSAMVQDHHGFMWVGTRGGGLCRFDGQHFRNFKKENGLISNEINDLVILGDNLYIASPKGLSKLNLNTYQTENLYSSKESVMSLSLNKRNKLYLVEGYYTLSVFDTEKKVSKAISSTPKEPIRSLKTDKNGELYLLTFFQNIFLVSDTTLTKEHGIKEKGNFDFVPVTRDSLYTLEAGKLYLNHPFSKRKSVLINSEEHGFLQSAAEELYLIGHEKLTILNDRLEPQKDLFTADIKQSPIRLLLKDKEKVLWIATNGNGFFKVPSVPVISFNNLSKGGMVIYNIAISPEAIVYATSYNEGTVLIKNNKLIGRVPSTKELDFEYFRNVVFDPQGRPHFFFRRYGEFILNQRRQLEKVAKPAKWPEKAAGVTLRYNSKGEKMYDTSEGLFIASQDSNYLLPTASMVNSTAEIAPDFYAVFTLDSLYFFKQGKAVLVPNAQMDKSHYILQSAYDKKENRLFWAELETGLYLYDFDTSELLNFDTEDGLHSQLIYNLTIDKNNDIWIGSEKGIEKIQFSSANKILSKKYYGKHEGFTGLETNSNSLIADDKNNVWIGSIYGLFELVDSLEEVNEVVYAPVLDQKSFLFDTLIVSDYETEKGLVLPYKLNSLSLSFKAVSQKYPNRAILYYRWKGEGHSWNEVPENGSLFLTNIDIGEHVLQIKNVLDLDESKLLEYSIHIKPPFYRTWWFMGLSVLILAFLVYRYQRWSAERKISEALRLRELKEQTENEIRQQLGQDFHDEVGNRLASISTQTGVLNLKMKNSGAEEKKILNQIQLNARKLYSDTKDFIWTINPESNIFSEIAMYIKDMGEKLFQYSEQDFLCNSEITSEMQDVILKSGDSMQLIMIFKEAMTNVLKHSKASKVEFGFSIKKGSWTLFLRDNGVGYMINSIENGRYGLTNMEIRSEKIKADLKMTSSVGEGTEIRIKKAYKNDTDI